MNKDEVGNMNECFANVDGDCMVLSNDICNYPNCKFYKTKADYIVGTNMAIKQCREKGLCDGCKYTKKACKLMK